MSISIFWPAILGPEMAAPILWAPKNAFLSAGKPHAHKIPRFRGGGGISFFWGQEVPILFLWARGFVG